MTMWSKVKVQGPTRMHSETKPAPGAPPVLDNAKEYRVFTWLGTQKAPDSWMNEKKIKNKRKNK